MSEVIYQYQQGHVPNNKKPFYFWVDCSKEYYESEKEEGGTVRMLYTAAPPAVLPPEVTEPVGEWCLDDREGAAWMAGANWMREQCLALGTQQQKVVELPQLYGCEGYHIDEAYLVADSEDGEAFLKEDVIAALDAANVKWEVKK